MIFQGADKIASSNICSVPITGAMAFHHLSSFTKETCEFFNKIGLFAQYGLKFLVITWNELIWYFNEHVKFY